jgi:hypothetical protein
VVAVVNSRGLLTYEPKRKSSVAYLGMSALIKNDVVSFAMTKRPNRHHCGLMARMPPWRCGAYPALMTAGCEKSYFSRWIGRCSVDAVERIRGTRSSGQKPLWTVHELAVVVVVVIVVNQRLSWAGRRRGLNSWATSRLSYLVKI